MRLRERFFGVVVVAGKTERAGAFAERRGLLDLEGSFRGGILGKGFLGDCGGVGELGFLGAGDVVVGGGEVGFGRGREGTLTTGVVVC